MSILNLLKYEAPFGLDISDLSLKVIALKRGGLEPFKARGCPSIYLRSHGSLTVPPDYFENGEIKRPEKIIPLIKKLLNNVQGEKITTKQVISVLPETKTFIKVIKVPNTPDKNLESLISEEIKNHIPVDLDEVYMDWQKLNDSDKKIDILVATTPKKIVDSYTDLLVQSGLVPRALEIESVAICRALVPYLPPKKAETVDFAQILIDFGATRTSLIVYDRDSIQFTSSIPISGESITQAITEKLKITREQAEKSKIVCGLDFKKCDGSILKIIMPNILEMMEKIESAMTFYRDNFVKGNQINKIILCGGGANFNNLNQIIKERFNLPVEIGNPLLNINPQMNNGLSFPKLIKKQKTSNQISCSREKLSFTTAIGLALRGVLDTK